MLSAYKFIQHLTILMVMVTSFAALMGCSIKDDLDELASSDSGDQDGWSIDGDLNDLGEQIAERLDQGRLSDDDVEDAQPPREDLSIDVDSNPSDEPWVYIHIRAIAEPFDHDDDLSSQTPLHHENGIRAFSMLRERDDEAPVLIFDHGADSVEAGYNDGDDTVVGGAPVAEIPEGRYAWGRVVISYVRYSVRATAHAQGFSVSGTFDNVQALSDGVEIDGVMRDAGWYRFVYEAAGVSFPLEGDRDAPVVPAWPSGAPIEAIFEDGELALYFPINIHVDHRVDADVHQIMEFNVHESFRWRDLDRAGYAEGVFDATPLSFEPVARFGANAYTHYIDGSIP